MSRLRIGIDVGGTNTDAVVVDEAGTVRAWCKTPTTSDVREGIRHAVAGVLDGGSGGDVHQIMLGTTHSLNAIIQRKELATVGILRIGAPATLAISPLARWPQDLVDAIRGPVAVIEGGHDYDGSQYMPLDERAVLDFAASCESTADTIALTAVGSPVRPDHEHQAAELIASVLGPDFPVTLGRDVAGSRIIERENTATLNAALTFVAGRIIDGLRRMLDDLALDAELYLTQNDGTLLSAEEAQRRPILTVGSGPTNSMRGAMYLSGLPDAIVMDVGGTSTDVGLLVDGFPRTSAHNVEIGGVRTNFRMPDLISVGLGGGTVVRTDPELSIGPDSVGYLLDRESRVFGGDTLTLSDISVAGGRARFGTSPGSVTDLTGLSGTVLAEVDERLHVLADRMKASRAAIPLIAVGGGAHLVPQQIPGVSEVVRVEHAGVANAIGAAIAEASGTVDRHYVFSDSSRAACLDEAKHTATEEAVRAGADPTRVRITSVTEIPMTYMPGECARVIVKAVGPLLETAPDATPTTV